MSAAAIPAGEAILGGAGISAGTGLLSSLATNSANKKIAQMNNAFNEKMLEKQMTYNTEMYNRQLGDNWDFYNDAKQNQWDMFNATNEYNSASAQRQRLEKAGLNPYMMMNGGSAGTASSVSGTSSSAPSAQGISVPTATPYSADYSGISNGIAQAVDIVMRGPDYDVKSEQANQLRIENKYKAGEIIANINNVLQNTKSTAVKTQLEQLLAGVQKDLASSTMQVNQTRIAQMKTQMSLTAYQTLMSEKQLSYMDQNQRLYVSSQLADIRLKLNQGKLTQTQARTEVYKLAEQQQKASLAREQVQGQKLQNSYQETENRFQNDTYNDRVREQYLKGSDAYSGPTSDIFNTLYRCLLTLE